MADRQLFSNNAVTLLMAAISPTDTSLTVMPGHGAMFPQPTLPGDYFLITLENEAATIREIIKVTGRTGDVFTGISRGQEGTTPLAWSASLGNDTLVDHRVTAGTLRLAMELPEAEPIALEDITNVSAAPPAAGDVLTWSGTQWQPAAPTGSGTAWIYGENTGPISIDPGWSVPVNTVTYSNFNRGFKFYVTVLMQPAGQTQTFEMLATVTGNIAANTEVVEWTRYSRVGYKFLGDVEVQLNVLTNQLSVVWTNDEALPVQVHCTRIQHTS